MEYIDINTVKLDNVDTFHIPEYGIRRMDLRSQDIVVVLKMVAASSQHWTYAELAKQLAMSPSQVFRSVDRAEVARLLNVGTVPPPPQPPDWPKDDRILPRRPNRANLKEFLIHGVKYVYPVMRDGLVRGVPTAYAAPPLNKMIAQSFEPPPVWPHAEGSVRGTSFSPLYKNVPEAAKRDPKLYELLALVDTIRDGRARESEIAIRELTARIDAA